MTRRVRAALAALAAGLAGCGYYAPPVRPEEDRVTNDTADEAPLREDDSQREESDG